MKDIKEIEGLAAIEFSIPDDRIGDVYFGSDIAHLRLGYKKGYMQCEQDNSDKKYTENDLHQLLKLRRQWYSHTDTNVVRDFIKSLNK